MDRAREHVIPQWLQEYLGVREEEFFQAIARTEDGTHLKERRHATQAFVEGRVCRKCNTVWMSDLEGQVQPTLIALMENQRPLQELSEQERLAIARWTLKTACLLSSAAPRQQTLPFTHCHFVREHADALPDSITFVGGQHKQTGQFSYLQKNTWPQFSTQRREDHPDRYKVALQLRGLLLLAAHWPLPAQFVLARGIHTPIWPIAQDRWYNLDLTPIDPYDSRLMLARFSDTLAVAHPETF